MAPPTPAFDQRFVLAIFLIGGIAFVAMLVLLIVDSDPERGSTAGTSTFSRSAIGHGAVATLIDRAGIPVTVNRVDLARRVSNDTLLIAAEPADTATAHALTHVSAQAGAMLVVLPRWRGVPSSSEAGWIGRARQVDLAHIQPVLQVFAADAKVHRPGRAASWSTNRLAANPTTNAPQLIQSSSLRPIVANADGMLLAEVRRAGTRIWILADPDVIANHGIGHGENASFVLDMIEALRPVDGRVLIDETLHGFRRADSLWRTILSPPFLPTAIQAGLATVLLAWASAIRFGRPEPRPPNLAPGTATLVRIGARLLRHQQDGRFLLESYAAAAVSEVRRQRLNRPATDQELANWLDRIGAARGTQYSFSELMRQVAAVPAGSSASAPDIVRLAQHLNRWRRDLTHGS